MERLDVDALDPDNPFEVDSENAPHLAKHMFMRDGRAIPISIADVRDYYSSARFYEGNPSRGEAHWLIVCRVDSVVVTVPVIPSNSGDPTRCRPIGLFPTTGDDLIIYLEDETR